MDLLDLDHGTACIDSKMTDKGSNLCLPLVQMFYLFDKFMKESF